MPHDVSVEPVTEALSNNYIDTYPIGIDQPDTFWHVLYLGIAIFLSEQTKLLFFIYD